jgi:hypothetical protein
MTRILVFTAAMVAMLVFAAAATANVTKFTFSDVTYADATTGEIEASVKNTTKSHLTYCGYFTDDYRESLGYYQAFSETTASTDPGVVEQFCLDHFDDRWQ